MRVKANLPVVPVYEITLHPRDNAMLLATHGRSIWIADLSVLEEWTPQVTAQEAFLFGIEPKIRWRETARGASASNNFAGSSEPAGLKINYYLKAKPKGEVKVQIFRGDLMISEIRGKAEPGLNSVLWNMNARRERNEAEKKELQDRIRRMRERGVDPEQSSARGRGELDSAYVSFAAPDGDYTAVLLIDGRKLSAKATILPDPGAVK